MTELIELLFRADSSMSTSRATAIAKRLLANREVVLRALGGCYDGPSARPVSGNANTRPKNISANATLWPEGDAE